MLQDHRDPMGQHDIIEDEAIRTRAELLVVEKEFFDKVWYIRSLIPQKKIGARRTGAPDEKLQDQIDEERRRVPETYGEDNVGPWNDWEWGIVNGKLSALRWMLGDEWEFLDT